MSVITVTDPLVRKEIEDLTKANTFPDLIQFIEDKDGNWITSTENLANPKYQTFSKVISNLSTKGVVIAYVGEKAAPIEGAPK